MRKNTVALNQAITYNDTQSKFIGRLRNWITSLSNFSIERALESALKSRSSKRYILLDAIKTVFPMFDIVAALFVNFRCMIRAVRGTQNFVCSLATLAQGRASEAQLNMDVNLRRLPECTMSMPKFLVPLQALCRICSWRTVQRPRQSNGKTVYNQAKHTLKNCWHSSTNNSKSPFIAKF